MLLTTPTRTVIDCFREERLPDGAAIGDGALRAGLTSPQRLRAMRAFQTRWPGVTKAADGIPLLDERRENWLESRSAAALWGCGIPLGVPQVVALDELRRFVARVDMAWCEQGVVGEADGARESRIRDLGLEVVRWDPREIVHTPGVVADRWEAAAARARSRLVTALLECSCCRTALTCCAGPTGSPLTER